MLLQTLKVLISWIPASTLWGLVYFMDEEKRHSSVHPRTPPSHARGRLRTWIQNSHFELLENSISLQDLNEGLHVSSFIHSSACSLSQQQTHSLFSEHLWFGWTLYHFIYHMTKFFSSSIPASAKTLISTTTLPLIQVQIITSSFDSIFAVHGILFLSVASS